MLNVAFKTTVALLVNPTPQGALVAATFPDDRIVKKTDFVALAGFAFLKYTFSQTFLADYSTLFANVFSIGIGGLWRCEDAPDLIAHVSISSFLYHDSTPVQLALAGVIRWAIYHGGYNLQNQNESRKAQQIRQMIPAALISLFYFSTSRGPFLPLIGALNDFGKNFFGQTLWPLAICSAIEVYFYPEGFDTPQDYLPYLTLTIVTGYVALKVFNLFTKKPQRPRIQISPLREPVNVNSILHQQLPHASQRGGTSTSNPYRQHQIESLQRDLLYFETLANTIQWMDPIGNKHNKEQQKASANESLKLHAILEKDPTLKLFPCAITQGVALDPCLDPTNPLQIYESYALKEWVQKNKTSPTTRKPLTVDKIIPLPKCKEFIEYRIEHIFEKPNEGLLKEAQDELKKYRSPKSSTKEEMT